MYVSVCVYLFRCVLDYSVEDAVLQFMQKVCIAGEQTFNECQIVMCVRVCLCVVPELMVNLILKARQINPVYWKVGAIHPQRPMPTKSISQLTTPAKALLKKQKKLLKKKKHLQSKSKCQEAGPLAWLWVLSEVQTCSIECSLWRIPGQMLCASSASTAYSKCLRVGPLNLHSGAWEK